MTLSVRNTLPGLDTGNPVVFYYLCLALLLLWIGWSRRVVRSRFGMALSSLRQNRRRSINLGIAPLRYQLGAFVMAAAGAGLAGALWANAAQFVSPDMASWEKSGEFMAMVILGGMGSIFGPVLGAVAYLGLEQTLTGYTEHWMLILGPLLVLVVLYGKRGLYGLLVPRSQHD
jgi:branched-chain amino acid transport system permease protein